MKAIDFLRQHADTLRRMNRAGLKSTALAQVGIYEEYRHIIKGGDTPYKAVMQLAIKHRVTERTIYRVIATMQMEV